VQDKDQVPFSNFPQPFRDWSIAGQLAGILWMFMFGLMWLGSLLSLDPIGIPVMIGISASWIHIARKRKKYFTIEEPEDQL
jgi:hypothetical protein